MTVDEPEFGPITDPKEIQDPAVRFVTAEEATSGIDRATVRLWLPHPQPCRSVTTAAPARDRGTD